MRLDDKIAQLIDLADAGMDHAYAGDTALAICSSLDAVAAGLAATALCLLRESADVPFDALRERGVIE